MGKATATYREMRFIIEDELLQVYVLIEAGGDVPFGVQGWHHKTFPASVAAVDVFTLWADGEESPILWAQQAPPR